MANYINNNSNLGVAYDHADALKANTAARQAIRSPARTGNSTCLANQPRNQSFSSKKLLPQAQPATQLWLQEDAGGRFAGPERPLRWTGTCCDFSTLKQQ